MKSPSTNMNSEKSVNVEDHNAVLSSAKMHLQILLAVGIRVTPNLQNLQLKLRPWL
jgi:hypothetical protein